MNMENNKPRDFFLHISTFTVLYFIAIALVTLIFTLIDYRFPDVLGYYYSDPYSGPVRFSIASLIILSPLFIVLMRRIQNEIRIHPERAALSIRKWLTYITLFLAGFTAVIDLITLLYSFLGGALPTAFLLKALTLLTISGAAFWYFFLDLKNFWQTHKRESEYAAYGFGVLVVSSIVMGFAVMGSPTVQRDIRLDEERRAHLEQIQSQVVNYWQNNETLPETTSQLNNPLFGFVAPTDPETGASYEYKTTGELSFDICATFTRESSVERKGEFYPTLGLTDGTNWKHDAGRTCFTRTIDTTLIKPMQLPAKEVIIN